MADNQNQPLLARAQTLMSKAMENLVVTVRNSFNAEPVETNTSSAPSNSKDGRGLRTVRIPEAKVGLGSTEGDLLFMAKKYLEVVGLVFFVWLLGYCHFSVSWILLAVFIYLFRQRQRIQFKLRHQMLNEMNTNEEQYIKARLDELPSWVFFPDVERAEWVNRIIKQAWPFANKYLDQAVFRETLIPLVRATAASLSDFSFQKLDLGEIPPRIGGIKVYTDNVRDQIMMDIEVFYAGDAQIKAKVKGVVCGIKDIQFVGDMRIILSPLINTIPLVGAMSYFFLKKPNIDFKLTDAGSLATLPGLNGILLDQINTILASMMVLPNRQVFPFVKEIPTAHLRYSSPQGIVRVFVLRARNLIEADMKILGRGKSDPFVRVKAQGSMEYKTKTINNNTNPEWNEAFELVVEQYETDNVEFEVFDEDPGKDDFLGRAAFPINSLVDKGAVDTWLTLQGVKKGSLNVSLQYFTLTTQKPALEIMEKINSQWINQEKVSKALLVCFIDRCLNLPRSKKFRREPNPFCQIRVEGSEARTQGFENQTNPQFEHVSQLLCRNPLHEKLRIDVCDSRNNNEVIAFLELPIKNIYNTENMTIDTQKFPLKSLSEPVDNAAIILRLSLLILSPGQAMESRLNPPPTSPSLNSQQSFDSLPTSATHVTTEMKRSTAREPTVRTPSEDDNQSTMNPSGMYRQPSSSGVRSLMENRQSPDRKNFVVADDPDLRSMKYGQIKLGIRYAASRRSLSLKVYACQQLINVHDQNLPDPYVRVHLLPDFRKDKKKTKSIHDTLSPNFDDLFEWSASLNDIHRQHLHLSIKNNSPFFAQEQTYMGELQIDLSNLDPERSCIAWYALQEPHTSAGGILKIKYDTTESTDQNSQF